MEYLLSEERNIGVTQTDLSGSINENSEFANISIQDEEDEQSSIEAANLSIDALVVEKDRSMSIESSHSDDNINDSDDFDRFRSPSPSTTVSINVVKSGRRQYNSNKSKTD